MKRIDVLILLIGCIAAVIIVWPIFTTEYLYTDEAPQFWQASKNTDNTFIVQGRFIAEKLLMGVYNTVDTAKGLIRVRSLALVAWLLCLPVWYFIMKRVVLQNNLPFVLAPLGLFYLVSIPAFALSIGWIACFQLFLANSSALLAGYLLYSGIHSSNKSSRALAIVFAVLFSMVSLFSYQSGFGCFYIPFFIELVATRKIYKRVVSGVVFSIAMFGLYFLLFRWQLHAMAFPPDERTGLSFDPIRKLIFLCSRPMAAAFHFNWLFNEKSWTGIVLYIVEAIVFLLFDWKQQNGKPVMQKIIYYLALFVFFGCIYFPSLVVNENYASNRTLLALNMAVLFMVASTVFSFIKTRQQQTVVAAVIALSFVAIAWYNFNVQFMNPIKKEYGLIKDFVLSNYKPATDSIDFVIPAEDAFQKKYHVVASWDEFGVPSTAKSWTPEFLLRQIIYDKTHNRSTAEKIVIRNYSAVEDYHKSDHIVNAKTIVVNVGEMLGTP